MTELSPFSVLLITKWELVNKIQDLFHVYLNKCDFQFLRLHINKTNTFCFLIDKGRVTGTTK